MKLEQIQMPVTNLLYTDYVANKEKIVSFFEYHQSDDDFVKRVDYLRTKTYQFDQLAKVIRSYMEPFGLSPKIEENLSDLQNGAFAIVGGQQAGILTGPLYSIHKAITVLLLAKDQSAKLQMPVVPIFWIAGEDHDLEEINHTYTIQHSQLKKRAYSKRTKQKFMASSTVFDKDEMLQTIRRIFADYGETEHTGALLKDVEVAIQMSTTFTDLFTYLMNGLFKQHGLLLIDAAYTPFRKLQSAYFVNLITNSKVIAKEVALQEQKLMEKGYPQPVQANENGVNLFYVRDGERHLLEWEDEFAINKSAQLKFTKEQLLEIANEHPELLSNNVITRPIMQDMILPVLSFVGGPGELAYWSILKPGFHANEIQMPIFTPRLHITLVTPHTQSILKQLDLTVEDVLSGKSKIALEQYLQSIQDREALEQVESMQKILEAQYNQLSQHLTAQQLQMEPVLQKNIQFHLSQLTYLKNKITQEVQEKHTIQIKRYEILHHELMPANGYQERIYSPYKYLNDYGASFINQLIDLKIELNHQHNVFYM